MSKRTLDASRGSDIHKHSAFIAKSALWRTTTEGRKSSLLSSPLAAVGQDASRHNIKKQSAGLATVLASQDSFEDCDVFGDAGQENRIGLKFTPHTPSATTNHGVYIDENDFSSDIDLDVEDPALKSTITYPKLPLTHEDAKVTFTKSVATKSVAAKAFAAKSLRQIPTSSNPLPWSSSPVFDQSPNIDAHVAKLLRDSEVQSVAVAEEAEEEERPAKRRSLPWPKSEVDRSQLSKTPHRKASNGELYALDTTASAIKTRQKDLRLKNKGHATAARPTGVDVKDDAVKKPKKLGISKLHLSDEQKHILDLVLNRGKSVFYTGSAGTGKSVLLREIITGLRKKYIRETDRVAVTASTGLAACNIGGVTLHSFAGIGLGKESVEELVKRIKRNQKAKHRWMRARILVIDEVSMVDGELFDKLESIARTIRKNPRPFGGIQLVVTGDFFQLPPVPDGNSKSKFAFDAHTWNPTMEYTLALHKIFRQKDPFFGEILNEMREGRLSDKAIEAFKSLHRPLLKKDEKGHFMEQPATELFPTRFEVERANQMKMMNLQGNGQPFMARDGGTLQDLNQREKLLQNCMAPKELFLKKGALVMLIKNIDETLVNGTLGRIYDFVSPDTYERQIEREARAGSEDIDAGRPGKQTRPPTTDQLLPLVDFTLPDGTERRLICHRESWKIELPDGEVQASRSQIPLILAWALSIHKAQGQTLERVKVDLGRVFEKGQAYVALSRATSMEGLQVKNFDPRKVLAHDRVRQFYAGLTRYEKTMEESSRLAT